MLQITAFYAALLAILFLVLSARVITWRQAHRVEFEHGGDLELRRRIRAHANFAEYVPLTLVVMGLAESMSPPNILVHLCGVLLLAGRLLHAYGISHTPPIIRYRVYGMVLTTVALGIAAFVCLALSAFFLAV
ncbi:MAG TPA: MAPEG family protein [Hyphomicrobium sp.]|nr:MAPEG family protein [Hyphomicrobium sp.]